MSSFFTMMNENTNSIITSLSGGMEILPGLRSEKLYFKPIIYKYEWENYNRLSQMKILNKYLLKMANAGIEDPNKLYNLMINLSNKIDYELLCDEIYHYNPKDAKYFTRVLDCLIYSRVLELGIWDAHFVTLGFVCHYKSSLETLSNCLMYNGNTVQPRVIAISGLYLDLLYSLKECDGKEFFPNSERICLYEFPQMISEMMEEIKDEPLPTTNYVSWAFEKAFNNHRAQEQWILNPYWNF